MLRPAHVELTLTCRVEVEMRRHAVDGHVERLDHRRRAKVARHVEGDVIALSGHRIERLLDAADADLADQIEGIVSARGLPAARRWPFPVDHPDGNGPTLEHVAAHTQIEDVARVRHASLLEAAVLEVRGGCSARECKHAEACDKPDHRYPPFDAAVPEHARPVSCALLVLRNRTSAMKAAPV